MPFTVIVLKKVPNSLRGDLTRWMQEIATGVYIGSFNSRVRNYLWNRVTDTVGQGEASICFSCRNEIGYSFCTFNTERQVIDYDGIPLVLIPAEDTSENDMNLKSPGFSNASKFHQAIRIKRAAPPDSEDKIKSETPGVSKTLDQTALVFLDIETTGLDIEKDQIIEIGAVKVSNGEEFEFHRLIETDISIPEVVHKLTGISNEMLKDKTKLEEGIQDFFTFIQGATLVGYNISFDIKFINRELQKHSLEPIHNQTIDLMLAAKRKNSFQTNYKFETTLKEYGINEIVCHRALKDARLMHVLYSKMNL